MRHKINLLAVMVSRLIRTSFDQINRILMLQTRIFNPVMVNGTLGYPVILEVLCFSDGLDVIQNRFFDIWIIEEL